MAGDWIKMRVWMMKDPKVMFMADRLAEDRWFMNWLTDPVGSHCNNTAYEHVTRDVTVALCVTALLVTWGTAREQGRREDDDLIVDFCDLDGLTTIVGVPGFGAAMAVVGWVKEEDGPRLRFPKFFRDNENPHDRLRSKAAERQARYRQHRKEPDVTSDVTSDVTGDVTVTHREEKSREEKSREKKESESAEKNGAGPSLSLAAPKGPIPINGNGTKPKPARRVPAEFDLTEPRLKFATGEGLTVKETEMQFDKMCDTEFRVAHSDWDAVWRNWVRTHVERQPKVLQRR